MVYYFRIISIKNKDEVRVIVANSYIKKNTVITKEYIKEVLINKQYIVTGYVKNKEDVVGKIAAENIYKDEQILQMNLVQNAEINGLSATIPEGYRAITTEVNMVSGVGGHIKTGDYVDILALIHPPLSDDEKVTVVFQNIEVINSGLNSSNQGGYITLCMTPKDAEKFFLIDELTTVRFILKNAAYKDNSSVPSVDFESLELEINQKVGGRNEKNTDINSK